MTKTTLDSCAWIGDYNQPALCLWLWTTTSVFAGTVQCGRYSKRRFRSPIHPSLSRSHSRKHCKFRSVLFADVVYSSTPYNTLPSSRLPLFPMFDQLSQKEGRRGKAIANINFHLRGRPAKGDPHVASFLATTNLKLFSVTLRKVEWMNQFFVPNVLVN